MSYYDLGDGDVVHINRSGPTEEIHNEDLGEKWCFVCRSRNRFIYSVTAEIEPSYYAPNPHIKCSRCGAENGDLFPGRIREWEE